MSSIKPILSLFGFVLLAMHTVFGQSDPTGSKAITNAYVIRNATVVTAEGRQTEGQDIFFTEGIIRVIGPSLKVPAEAEIIDGEGMFVYPGFIDMANKSAMQNPPTKERPKDFDPSNPADYFAGIHPHLRALDFFDFTHADHKDWRKSGFTLVQKIPQGMGSLPGKTAVVGYNDGQTPMVVMAEAALYTKFSTVAGMYPSNNLGVMAKLRDLLENARLHAQHRQLHMNNPGVPLPAQDPVLQELAEALGGRRTLYFEINSELDIVRALQLREQYGLKLILGGIAEAGNQLKQIADMKVPVSLTLHLPEKRASDDSLSDEAKANLERVEKAYHARLAMAGEFEEAGIVFGFTTKYLAKDKLLENLRLMVTHGLTEKAALAALTINPAKILGIDRVAGDIQPGKLANFVITDSPLFEESSYITYVVVGGRPYKNPEKKKEQNGEDKADTLAAISRAGAERMAVSVAIEKNKVIR